MKWKKMQTLVDFSEGTGEDKIPLVNSSFQTNTQNDHDHLLLFLNFEFSSYFFLSSFCFL